jgi:hypothetical protein
VSRWEALYRLLEAAISQSGRTPRLLAIILTVTAAILSSSPPSPFSPGRTCMPSWPATCGVLSRLLAGIRRRTDGRRIVLPLRDSDPSGSGGGRPGGTPCGSAGTYCRAGGGGRPAPGQPAGIVGGVPAGFGGGVALILPLSVRCTLSFPYFLM